MDRVVLSRRNLQTLLNKLDRAKEGGETNAAIIKVFDSAAPEELQQTMDNCLVRAVEDDVLYAHRQAGPMLAVDAPPVTHQSGVNGGDIEGFEGRIVNIDTGWFAKGVPLPDVYDGKLIQSIVNRSFYYNSPALKVAEERAELGMHLNNRIVPMFYQGQMMDRGVACSVYKSMFSEYTVHLYFEGVV